MSWHERNKQASRSMSDADRARFSRNAFIGACILFAYLSVDSYWLPTDRTSTALASTFQIFKGLIEPIAGDRSMTIVYGVFGLLCVAMALF